MLLSWKFWHELFVLHSMIIASVCVRFGNPALYQQGSDAQLPSPGWKVLIVPVQGFEYDECIHMCHAPVKLAQAKSCMFTVELFGRSTTDPSSS